MTKKLGLILVLLLTLNFSLWGCAEPKESTPTPASISKTKFLLGTVVTIQIFDSESEDVLNKAFSRLEEIEKQMSINIKDSDVSRVNEKSGVEAVKVHDDVYFVLKKAKEYAELTDGAFDPTIGPLVKLWGIGTEDAKVPSQVEIEEKLEKVDYNKLELLDDNKVFLKEKGMMLDLGGIAKGYGADEVVKILSENGIKSAIIDLGGNVFVMGKKSDGSKWRVGIQNPFEVRGGHIGIVQVSDRTVVTSGIYERYFTEDGKRYHHIIDTQTGYPAENNVAGISIIAKSSIDADALSTSLFVLGTQKGIELAEKIEDLDAIFVTKDNKLYGTDNIEEIFNLENDEFQFQTR